MHANDWTDGLGGLCLEMQTLIISLLPGGGEWNWLDGAAGGVGVGRGGKRKCW